MRAKPNRRSLVGALLWALVCATAGAGGCATTATAMSAERQQRISECLKQCPASPAEAGPATIDDRALDQRNDCERRCHALR